MHLCIDASTHAYIYAVIHLRMYACMHVCMYAHMYTCRPWLDTVASCFPALPLFLFAMARTYFGMPDASTLGATSCMCVCVALASRRAKHTSLRRPFSAVGSCLRPMPPKQREQFRDAPEGPGWVALAGRLYYVTDRKMWHRAIYSGEYERARTYVVSGLQHFLEARRARDSSGD